MFRKKKPKIRRKAAIVLENGDIFYGEGVGIKGIKLGELCFNTAMTGYQEAITDPSYASQILLFTFPHIGITGTNLVDIESKRIFLSGVIFKSLSIDYSNWRGFLDIDAWLVKNKIVGINKINTRDLTIKLRESGALKGAILNGIDENFNPEKIIKKIKKWPGIEKQDLAAKVSCLKSKLYKSKSKNIKTIDIVALDFGCKQNIIELLSKEGFNITLMPYNSTYDEIKKHNPQGIFLSNGPGDPAATGKYAIPIIKKFIKMNLPVFGICLGHQLLGLSLGAKTKKMNLGHRGANHPVKNLIKGNVEITSQNHGFEIVRKNLPKNIKITHQSLFDNSIEGIKLKSKPVFSVQYHPESNPGPQDSIYLFEEFIKSMKQNAKKKRY